MTSTSSATLENILASKCWSSPRHVNTRHGPRILRTMPAQGAHYHFQQSDPIAFRKAGLSFGSDTKGRATLCHWQENKAAEILERASRATSSAVTIPAPPGCEYLPFQKAGIQYAVSAPHVIIGDEMGLGKTVQALGVLNCMPWSRALIICPATLKLNWRREAEKWLLPGAAHTEFSIINPGDEYASRPLGPHREVVIINPELLLKHEAIMRARWDVVIPDEAHYYKNKDAKRTKAVMGLDGGKFIFLTGTPLLNRPVELWTMASKCAPEAFPNYWAFVKRYCDAQNNGYGWEVNGASNLGELQTRLRQTCLVRRLKSEVLAELPPKRRQIIELPPTKEMKVVLDKENREWSLHEDTIASLCERRDRAAIADDDAAYRDAASELKEAWKVAFTHMAVARRETALAKLPLCVQALKDALEGGGKVVVFAHHKEVITNLMEELSSYSPVVIRGDTDNEDRQPAVDRFQTDPSCRVFIGSIRAAGVGITLTASSHVVFVEEDWTPGMISQAEDRCHRIGQADSVLVQHLVLEGSLDSTMVKRCIEKQEIAELALDREPTPEDKKEHHEPAAPRKPSRFSAVGAKMGMGQREAIHEALKIIAGLDGDKARARNGAGFSKFDSAIGHELANTQELSPGQVGYGWGLARKYRKQLPTKIINLCNFDEI